MVIPFLVIMLLVTLAFLIVTHTAVERIEHNHYAQRADFFHKYPVNKGDIVFMGDSITDGGCWEELFPSLPVKNRGINADTTAGVLNRVDDILKPHPLALFLLIGTNDLPWHAYRHNEDILCTYELILKKCRELSPETRVFIQSIFPRKPRYARRIQGLNSQLELLAAQFNHTYIDLYSSFADTDGGLKNGLTNDHLHILAEGYTRWVALLRPYIDSLQKK